jgi:N4-gp56 family major capsid protein
MATSTFPATGGFVDNTSAATFIPEIWSDEIIAAYQKNLVLAPLIKKMSMKGKKGDTIHIPAPTRGAASAKVENQAVTVQNAVESEVVVTIDKHYEYSRIIEDITETQALSSLRQFYTGDAGYGLAKQVDDDLFSLGKSFGDGDGTDWTNSATYYCDASTGLTAYAVDTVATADVFTDECFRKLIQLMDDNDVPMDNRSFVIPPALRNAIMGINRYVSSDFVEGRSVVNGKLGNLYGVDIFVTSNCPILETAVENAAGGIVRGAQFIHKDASVLAEQMGVRSQTQYKQEFLGTLYTADMLYGTKVVRPEAGFVLAVNG